MFLAAEAKLEMDTNFKQSVVRFNFFLSVLDKISNNSNLSCSNPFFLK